MTHSPTGPLRLETIRALTPSPFSAASFKLPSTRFRRQVGAWAGLHTDPQGNPITAAEFEAKKAEWLPTEDDIRFVKSLMQRVTEPGKMAAWIAPPDRGINAQPVDYEYVKL